MSEIFSRYLDTAGDGSGTKNANGDYSSAEEIFYIAPESGETFEVARMIVSVYDTSVMQTQEYGNLAAALGNGVTVRLSNADGVVADLTDGIPITTNAEWGALCYDVSLKSWGSGNELLVVRWTFEKAGKPIRLDGNLGEKFEIVLNDDLRGLLSHYFIVQGLKH